MILGSHFSGLDHDPKYKNLALENLFGRCNFFLNFAKLKKASWNLNFVNKFKKKSFFYNLDQKLDSKFISTILS